MDVSLLTLVLGQQHSSNQSSKKDIASHGGITPFQTSGKITANLR